MSTPARATPVRRTPARRGSGEALRTEIIEAASDLLGESGDVSAMSLRAVARRVGIATTSIYLHFADIDELILAVKLKRFAELRASLEAALAAAGADPVERVRAIGRSYVAFGNEHPGHYRVMFSASTRGQLSGPPGLFIGMDTFGVLVAEVGAALGLPATDRETHAIATGLWAMVHGIVHLHTARPHFPWPDQDDLIDTMVDRLLGRH